jgi:hypothetical protein
MSLSLFSIPFPPPIVDVGAALPNPGINWGPNVYIFDPTEDMTTLQTLSDTIFNNSQDGFNDNRSAIFLKSGTYDLNIQAGFFTTIHGLGDLPDDTTVNGGVNVLAPGSALGTFWRGFENLAVNPTIYNDTSIFATSQACWLRRMHFQVPKIIPPPPPNYHPRKIIPPRFLALFPKRIHFSNIKSQTPILTDRDPWRCTTSQRTRALAAALSSPIPSWTKVSTLALLATERGGNFTFVRATPNSPIGRGNTSTWSLSATKILPKAPGRSINTLRSPKHLLFVKSHISYMTIAGTP